MYQLRMTRCASSLQSLCFYESNASRAAFIVFLMNLFMSLCTVLHLSLLFQHVTFRNFYEHMMQRNAAVPLQVCGLELFYHCDHIFQPDSLVLSPKSIHLPTSCRLISVTCSPAAGVRSEQWYTTSGPGAIEVNSNHHTLQAVISLLRK